MHEITGAPRPDVDPALVAVVNDHEQFMALGEDARARVRYVLLSHDNDGVTKFGLDLLNRRPAWLGPDRPRPEEMPGRSPRGIPPAMRWRPVTTFFQTLIDMKNAQMPGAVPGVGARLPAPTCRSSSATSTTSTAPTSRWTRSRTRCAAARSSARAPSPDPGGPRIILSG